MVMRQSILNFRWPSESFYTHYGNKGKDGREFNMCTEIKENITWLESYVSLIFFLLLIPPLSERRVFCTVSQYPPAVPRVCLDPSASLSLATCVTPDARKVLSIPFSFLC